MTNEEILKCAAESPMPDEREVAMENESDSKALTFSIALCVVLAVVKIFAFKEKPYDLFAIEFLTLAAGRHVVWKRLRKKQDLVLSCIFWTGGILALIFFIVIEVLKRA